WRWKMPRGSPAMMRVSEGGAGRTASRNRLPSGIAARAAGRQLTRIGDIGNVADPDVEVEVGAPLLLGDAQGMEPKAERRLLVGPDRVGLAPLLVGRIHVAGLHLVALGRDHAALD